MMKKWFASIMVVVMLLNAAPLSGFVELDFPDLFSFFASAESYSGTCGENVTWKFNEETGELVISGIGEMYNYYSSPTPWNDYRSSIQKITINDGVTSIGDDTFYGCTKLTSATISNSVIKIGAGAFSGCNSFLDVYYYGTYEEWDQIDVGDDNDWLLWAAIYSVQGGKCGDNLTWLWNELSGELVISGEGSMMDYSADELPPWRKYCADSSINKLIICDGVEYIGDYAFYGCQIYDKVIIPDSVTSIGDYAFYCATFYDEVILPDGVTSIGDYAFSCMGLTSITIPDSVTFIGWAAFYGCTSLTSISIGSGVTRICGSAFGETGYVKNKDNWVDGTALYIDDILITSKNLCDNYEIRPGTRLLADFALFNCDDLTGITIPESVVHIGEFVLDDIHFYKNTNYIGTISQWNKISIGDNNRQLLENVLFECNSERPFFAGTCGDDITWTLYTDGEMIFDGKGEMYDYDYSSFMQPPWSDNASLIVSAVISEDITNIGDDAFYLCVNLVSVEIPDSVTSVGKQAFRSCASLASVIIPDSVTSIGDYAFYSCDSLTDITIPDSVTKIGLGVFFECQRLEHITLPNQLTTISMHMLNGCVNLESIIIPESVTEIGERVFDECTGLKQITIPDSVESIGDYAFCNCTGLTSVTLPSGIAEIKNAAFSNCNSITDVYYYGTQQDWNDILILENNECLINATIHFNYAGHECEYGEWMVIAEPTATETGTKTRFCIICAEVETVTITATGFETAEEITIDFANNTISGINLGESTLEKYLVSVDESYTWEYETINDRLGTGSRAMLKDGDTVIGEYTILIYGDTTGDSWYDGQDAIIVDCLANGMLTKEDVGEAVYTAADCNHDGVIDQLDAALLNEAGTLLSKVDQSKPAKELLETSSEYVEYLDLIDQSPEIEAEDEAEDTTPEQDAKVDFFEMIINFIKSIFEMIFSYIPVPLN